MPFLIPVFVLLLLLVGKGGKWEPADHFSKALVILTAFIFLGKTKNISPLFKAAYGVCGLLTLSAILSPAPLATWASVSGAWSLVFLSALGMGCWTDGHREWLSRILAGVVCVQGLIHLGARFFSFLSVDLFPGNLQYFSFWCCAVFFISAERIINKIAFPRRIPWRWGVAAGLSLWGILTTPVRSGLVGLGIGSLVFLGGRFGLRGVLGGVGLFSLLFVSLPDNQLEKVLKLDQVGSYKRVDIWQTALSAVADRPFLGWGPGQFENAYWIHEQPQDGPVRFEMTTDRAHNDWLQVFVAGGVPAGLLTMLVFGLLWRSLPKGTQLIGPKSALVSMAAFGLVNSPTALPVCGVLIGIVVGLAPNNAMSLSSSPMSSRWSFAVKTGAFILFVGEMVLLINSCMGEKRSLFLDATRPSRVETIRDRLDREIHSSGGSVIQIEKNLQNLLRWNPHRAELWRDYGHLKSDHQNPPDLSGALACYEQALLLRPHHAPWWLEKSHIFNRAGDVKSAMEASDRALSLEPFYFDAALNLGYYYFKMGQMDEAQKRIGTLSAGYNNWPSALWNDSGYRKTILHKDKEAMSRALGALQ